MALINKTGIASGSIIYPEHVLRSIEALRGETGNDIILSGSLIVSASSVKYKGLLQFPGAPSAYLAYNTSSGDLYWTDYITGSGSPLVIDNNVNGYILTATGTEDNINGESALRFDGVGLIIGNTGSAEAKLHISGSGPLLLIRNNSGSGIDVTEDGILRLTSQSSTPTPVGGGIYYNGSEFYLGIE
jgi:hypothetical protein